MTWGGSRKRVRPDDRRGGSRPGVGRARMKYTIRRGELLQVVIRGAPVAPVVTDITAAGLVAMDEGGAIFIIRKEVRKKGKVNHVVSKPENRSTVSG